jgi:hypothetical protein
VVSRGAKREVKPIDEATREQIRALGYDAESSEPSR